MAGVSAGFDGDGNSRLESRALYAIL